VYVAAANMEFRAQKESAVARSIFERGMKRFAAEPGFVLAYVRFLDHLNEDVNMQVLFERVLKRLEPEDAAPIWSDFLHFTYETRDLDAAERVEARHSRTLPNVSGWQVEPLVERYRFLDLWPCSPAELHALSYARVSHQQDLAERETHEGRTRRGRGGRGAARSSAAAVAAKPILDPQLLQVQHQQQAEQLLRKQFAKCNPSVSQLLEYHPLVYNGYSNPLLSLVSCSLLERIPLTEEPHRVIVAAGPYTPDGSLCSADRLPAPLLELVADLPPAPQLAAVVPAINVDRLCEHLLATDLPALPVQAGVPVGLVGAGASVGLNGSAVVAGSGGLSAAAAGAAVPGAVSERKRKAGALSSSVVGSKKAPRDLFRDRQAARLTK